jgi:preprotein translocase subunit Sec61beta
MSSRRRKRENVPVMSMAGLIRYYEDVKEKVKISPTLLIIISIALIAGVILASKIVPPP